MEPSPHTSTRRPNEDRRFRLEMVNCRRSPTATDLSLKDIEFGLMTGPAICVPGLPNEGDLPRYYNALWN